MNDFIFFKFALVDSVFFCCFQILIDMEYPNDYDSVLYAFCVSIGQMLSVDHSLFVNLTKWSNCDHFGIIAKQQNFEKSIGNVEVYVDLYMIVNKWLWWNE